MADLTQPTLLPTRTKARRFSRALGVAALLALLTSGCATVQTQLHVEDDGSGSRDMAVVVSDDSLANAEITRAQLESSVKKHLPEQLEFEGMSTRTEDGKDAAVLEFRLDYANVEEYEQKVEEILAASKDPKLPKIVQVRTDSPLVTGFQVQENFTSEDLLRWVEAGLKEDGVLGDQSVQTSTLDDPNVVTVGKEKYEVTSGQLRVDDVKDHGFSNATVILTPAGEGRYGAELQLGLNREIERETRDRVEAYFKDHLPEGASLSPLASGDSVTGYSGGYRVTLGEGTMEELTERLKKVTGEEDTRFEQHTRSSDADPLAIEDVITYRLDARELLSPTAGDSAVNVRVQGDQEGQSARSAQGTQSEVVSSRRTEVKEVANELKIKSPDEVEATTTYVLPAAEGSAVRDAVEQALRPEEGVGELAVEEKDDVLGFTVSFKGDPADVSRRATMYSGGPVRIEFTEVEGGLRPRQHVDVNMSGMAGKLRSTPEGGPTLTVHPPTGAKVEAKDVVYGRLADGAVHAMEQGAAAQASFFMRTTSLGWWLLMGGIAFVVLGLLAAGVWLWRRNAAGSKATPPAGV